jgi:RND family efflux transporter MFP subunit
VSRPVQPDRKYQETVADLKSELAALKIDRESRERSGPGPAVWTAIVIVVIAVGAAGWWWTKGAQAAAVKTAEVEAQTQGAAGIPGAVLNASGYVTARRRATVSSKITGKVVEVRVEEGMAIRRGEVLARLDDAQVRAALALAESQLASARRGVTETEVRLREAELTLRRRRELAKEGVIGQADLDSAEAEADSLRARIDVMRQEVEVAARSVEVRRTDLADTVIRAPFDGVAISKDAQPGEMVSPISAGGGFTRTGICTLVDMSSLEIEVDVSESYINRVKDGQRVTAVLDAYPDWRIPARVITTVPTADRQKATVLVRIAFDPSTLRPFDKLRVAPSTVEGRQAQGRPEPSRGTTRSGSSRATSRDERLDPRILPDMGVKVAFHADEGPPAGGDGAQAARPRLLVPKAAVRQADGRDVVFVLRDDRVERRAVRVGAAEGDRVEIVSGVTAGEHVVIDGPAELSDGSRVRVQQ